MPYSRSRASRSLSRRHLHKLARGHTSHRRLDDGRGTRNESAWSCARGRRERFVTEQAWADVYNGDDWRTRECMPMLLPPRASVPQARNASGSAPYDQSDSVIFVAVPRPSAHHTSAVSTQRDGCSFINMSFTSESPIPKISKYTRHTYVEAQGGSNRVPPGQHGGAASVAAGPRPRPRTGEGGRGGNRS